MIVPPFKRASEHPARLHSGSGPVPAHDQCCGAAIESDEVQASGSMRLRLWQIDPTMHCSIIGTCLGTAELRRVVGRFRDLEGLSDLEVHHEAVGLARNASPASKALNKCLENRHELALGQFARVRGIEELSALWDEASMRGEIPGAYWAVLTHRDATTALRQRAFGDVHMLSHLVGASNRADLRRLQELEAENLQLRERLDRQQLRARESLLDYEAHVTELREALDASASEASDVASASGTAHDVEGARRELEEMQALVAVQTARREKAELASSTALARVAGLEKELDGLRRHCAVLGAELGALERELEGEGGAAKTSLASALRGRRVLYVGGRPSSTTAIRDLVETRGGEFRNHDGGLEDRKGLLAAAVVTADLVVFPVDCVDHDSAGTLKRLCTRHGIEFLPLRSASLASFAAAFASVPPQGRASGDSGGHGMCVRHG